TFNVKLRQSHSELCHSFFFYKGTSSHTPTRSPNHFSVPSSLGHSMSSSGRATASCVSGTSTISNTLTSKSPTFQFPKTGSYSFASTQSASSSPSKLHSRSFTSSCSQTRTFTLTASRVVTLSRQTSSLSASTSAIITSSPIPSGSASVPHLSSTLSCSETATFSLSFPNSMSTSVSQSESASPTTTVSFSNDRISPSSSIYCALVPANNARSVGGLMALAESSSSYVTIIPESTVNVSLTSQSLERGILLLPSKFALNLSLQLGGTIRGGPVNGWALVSVLLNVLSTDALFPLLTDSLSFTVNSTNVVDREQTLVIVLQPPRFSAKDPRWLPTSLSTFRTVTLHITLLLRCPTDPNVTSDVIVIVPCPGELQPLASEVKSAGIAAQFLSFFSGLGAGSSVSRLVAVRKLVLCSSDSAIQGLLPFSLTSCDDDIVASDARGNVLGNVVLWISGCSFIIFVVLGYASLARVSWRNAVDRIGVPSQLFPLVLVTVPSTVSAAMVLSHSTACAINIVVAAAAFLMCLFPVVMLSVVAHNVPRRLTLVSRSNEARTADSSTGSLLCSSLIVPSSVAIVLKSISIRNARWVEMPQHQTAKPPPLKFWRWSRVTTVVILEYTVIWYACLDLAVVTTASFLGAVGILGSDVACQASAIVVLLLYVGQLILCAIFRPFTTLLSHVYALLTLALGTVTVACQAWYLFAATETSNANLDLLRQVLTAAAICDLLVSGLSMLRMLLDAFEVLKACRRLFLKRNKHRTLDCSKSNDGNDDTLSLPHMCMSLEPEGPFLLDEAKLVDDCGDWSRSNASVDDGLVVSNGTDVEGETSTYYDPFWNFDGSAVVANADYSHVRRIATAREEVELDQRHRLIESLH
ncbi:transmembrane protein, putative, partial [Bodo saltans]